MCIVSLIFGSGMLPDMTLDGWMGWVWDWGYSNPSTKCCEIGEKGGFGWNFDKGRRGEDTHMAFLPVAGPVTSSLRQLIINTKEMRTGGQEREKRKEEGHRREGGITSAEAVDNVILPLRNIAMRDNGGNVTACFAVPEYGFHHVASYDIQYIIRT